MKSLAVLFVISLLFLAGGCSENSSLVSPIDENVTIAKVPVPFKMKSEDGSMIVIPTGLTTGSTVFELSGTATHIGKFTAVGSNDYVVTGLTTGVGHNGVLNLVSANGDEIYVNYTGSWIINSEGLYDYTLNMSFNSGTGRFVGITGEITVLAVAENVEPGNPLSKTVTAEGDGWVLFQ
jgi:hypothetical protein